MTTATPTLPRQAEPKTTPVAKPAIQDKASTPTLASRLLKTTLVLGAIIALFPITLYIASGYDPFSLLVSIPEALVILALITGPVTALLYYADHTE